MTPNLLFVQTVEVNLPERKNKSGQSDGNIPVKIGGSCVTIPLGGSKTDGICGDQFVGSQSQSTNIDEKSSSAIILDLVNNFHVLQVTEYRAVEPQNAPVYMAYTGINGTEKAPHYYVLDEICRFVEVEEVNEQWKPIRGLIGMKPSDMIQRTSEVETKVATLKVFSQSYEEYKQQTSKNGEEFLSVLKKYTKKKEYSDINTGLAALNKDNIVPFLEDYYKASEYKGDGSESFSNGFSTKNKGIMERLDHEHDAGAKITMENKKNVVNSLLKAAYESGLQNTDEYKKIQEIIKLYEPGEKYETRTNLRGDSKKGSWIRNLGHKGTVTAIFATIGAIVGGVTVGATAAASTGGTATLCGVAYGVTVGGRWGAAIGSVVAIAVDELCHACRWGYYKPSDSEILDENMYKLYEQIQAVNH